MDRQEQIHKLGETFFRTTPDLACIADAESLVLVNDRWTEKLGWSADELKSHPFLFFVHPDDVASTEGAVSQLLQGANLVEFQNRYRAADGSWHELEWNACLDPDLGMFVASARDVTRANREKAEHQRQARIFESVAEMQSSYMDRGLSREWWQAAIGRLIEITGSEFGFIGRAMTDHENRPYLLMLAVTNIAWNDWSRKAFDQYFERGLEFRNLDNLFGYTLLTGQEVLTNEPSEDPRSGGLPEGHPELQSFAGIPLNGDSGPIGMVALANRPEGFDHAVTTEIEPIIAMLSNSVATALAEEQADKAKDEVDRLEKRIHGLTETRETRDSLANRAEEILDQPDLSAALSVVRAAARESDPSIVTSLFLVDEERPHRMVEFSDTEDLLPAERNAFLRTSCVALTEGRVNFSQPGLALGVCGHVSPSDYVTFCVPLVAAHEEFGLLTAAVPSLLRLEREHHELLVELQEKLEVLSGPLARVASRERLVARVLKDFLTKLPNRAAFEQVGARLMSRDFEQCGPFGIIIFDLDSFKEINDSHGHKAGDLTLVEVGAAVKATLRGEDTVARIGGDEFAVVVTSCDETKLKAIAGRIREAARSVELDFGFQPSVSVGAVLVDDPEADWNQTVDHADAAMYEAKRMGGDRVVVRSELELHGQ